MHHYRLKVAIFKTRGTHADWIPHSSHAIGDGARRAKPITDTPAGLTHAKA